MICTVYFPTAVAPGEGVMVRVLVADSNARVTLTLVSNSGAKLILGLS